MNMPVLSDDGSHDCGLWCIGCVWRYFGCRAVCACSGRRIPASQLSLTCICGFAVAQLSGGCDWLVDDVRLRFIWLLLWPVFGIVPGRVCGRRFWCGSRCRRGSANLVCGGRDLFTEHTSGLMMCVWCWCVCCVWTDRRLMLLSWWRRFSAYDRDPVSLVICGGLCFDEGTCADRPVDLGPLEDKSCCPCFIGAGHGGVLAVFAREFCRFPVDPRVG